MTTLTATAIITAIDRASPVFARVGAQAAAAAKVYGGMAQQINQAGRAVQNTFAMPAALALGAIVARTQEFEKALAGVQIAGIADNLKDGVVNFTKIREEAEKTKNEALKLSEALRLSPTGLLKAGEAAGKMGLAGDKANKLMEMAGSVHVQDREISPDKAAEFLGSMGINFKAGKGTRSYEDDITQIANQWIGVANMTRTTASRMEGGLRQFAPLLASMGENFMNTSALLGGMVQAGQWDVESGTALKSLASRFIAPTNKGADAMFNSGFNRGKYMDLQGVDAGTAFKKLKAMTNAKVSKGDWDAMKVELEEGGKNRAFGDYHWQQSFLRTYNKATGANDEETRDANRERLGMSVLTGGGKLKFYEAVKELAALQKSGKLTDFGMTHIGQKQHISRYKALFTEMETVDKLREKLGQINDEFTKAGNQIWRESAAGQWEGMVAAIDRMLTRIRETKGFGGLVSGLEGMANAVDRMAQVNPAALNAIVTGLLAFVGLGAAGLVISALGSGLATIAAALASPAILALVAAGGIGAMLGAFSAENGQALVGALTQMGAAVAQIGGGIGDAVSGIQALFGIDAGKGANLAGILNKIGLSFAMISQGVGTLRQAYGSGPTGGDPGAELSADLARRHARGRIDGAQAESIERWRQMMFAPNRTPREQPLIREQQPANGVPFWPSFAVPDPLAGLRSLTGTVTGTVDVRVKVDGPGQVTEQKGGEVKGQLNTGKSMPDVGAGKQ